MKTQSLGYFLTVTKLKTGLVTPSDQAKNWPVGSIHRPEDGLGNSPGTPRKPSAGAALQKTAVFSDFESHRPISSLLSTCCHPLVLNQERHHCGAGKDTK
jgi:hypothetical protein